METKELKRLLNIYATLLPTITMYSECLNLATRKFNITTNEARNKFGLFTCDEWLKLLF